MNKSALSFLIPGLVIGFVAGFAISKTTRLILPTKASFVQPENRLERAKFRVAYLDLRNTLDRAVTCQQAARDFDAGYWQGKFQELRKSTNYGLFADDVKIVDADIQVMRGPAQFQCPIGGSTEVVKTSDIIAKVKLLEKITS